MRASHLGVLRTLEAMEGGGSESSCTNPVSDVKPTLAVSRLQRLLIGCHYQLMLSIYYPHSSLLAISSMRETLKLCFESIKSRLCLVTHTMDTVIH